MATGFSPSDSPAAHSGSAPPAEGVTARHEFAFATLWNWVKNAYEIFGNINGSLWSASFAYYAFFALFPLLIFLVTIVTGFTSRQQAFSTIVNNVEKYLPLGGDDQEMIAKTINGVIDARGSIGLVSLVGLLWSSLGFFQALVGAVGAAWKQDPLNWWRLPLKNLKMFGVLISAMLLGNLLPVVSKTIQGYLPFLGAFGHVSFTLVNLLVPTLVLFYGFVLFYRLAPRRATHATFSLVWLPALVVTVLLQIAQYAFVIYATHFASFNAVYGTFGGVIALMLWIYVSGLIVIFGGCLCAARVSRPASPHDATAAGEATR
jgi:YihY family inner membrane protein